MTKFLLDTNAAAHYINRRHGVRERAMVEIAAGNRIGICVPVLGELWFGVENSESRDRNVDKLTKAIATWILWPYDTSAARSYGIIAARLRRSGRKIQQIDMMIAAVALSLTGCTIVSSDGDFSAVEGLAVENWAISIP